jgi:hypothetical protein
VRFTNSAYQNLSKNHSERITPMTLQQYLQHTAASSSNSNPGTPRPEGTELTAGELFHELFAPRESSICATVIAETEEELRLHLRVKKWKEPKQKAAPVQPSNEKEGECQ